MGKFNTVDYDIGYPVYGAKFLNERTLLVTGGGGAGNQEISNRLTALTINLTKKKKPIKKFRELKLNDENDAPSCLDSNNNIILLGCNEGKEAIADGHNHNLQKFIYVNDHLKYLTSTSLETGSAKANIYQKHITISKDGSIAAVASSKISTTIHILDPVNLYEKYEIETNNDVKDLDISPDGKNLTYITKNNTLEIISIITGRSFLRRIDFNPNHNLNKVKFLDDNHVIVAVSFKNGDGAGLVKLSLSQKLKAVKETLVSKKIKSITSIDINLKNGVIAVSGNENSVFLFKAKSLKKIKQFNNVHSLSISKLTFSPDGHFLASVSVANTINIIEIPDAIGIETHHIYNICKRSIQLLVIAVFIQLGFKYYQSRESHKNLDFSEYFTLTQRSAQPTTSITSYYEPKFTGVEEKEKEPVTTIPSVETITPVILTSESSTTSASSKSKPTKITSKAKAQKAKKDEISLAPTKTASSTHSTTLALVSSSVSSLSDSDNESTSSTKKKSRKRKTKKKKKKSNVESSQAPVSSSSSVSPASTVSASSVSQTSLISKSRTNSSSSSSSKGARAVIEATRTTRSTTDIESTSSAPHSMETTNSNRSIESTSFKSSSSTTTSEPSLKEVDSLNSLTSKFASKIRELKPSPLTSSETVDVTSLTLTSSSTSTITNPEKVKDTTSLTTEINVDSCIEVEKLVETSSSSFIKTTQSETIIPSSSETTTQRSILQSSTQAKSFAPAVPGILPYDEEDASTPFEAGSQTIGSVNSSVTLSVMPISEATVVEPPLENEEIISETAEVENNVFETEMAVSDTKEQGEEEAEEEESSAEESSEENTDSGENSSGDEEFVETEILSWTGSIVDEISSITESAYKTESDKIASSIVETTSESLVAEATETAEPEEESEEKIEETVEASEEESTEGEKLGEEVSDEDDSSEEEDSSDEEKTPSEDAVAVPEDEFIEAEEEHIELQQDAEIEEPEKESDEFEEFADKTEESGDEDEDSGDDEGSSREEESEAEEFSEEVEEEQEVEEEVETDTETKTIIVTEKLTSTSTEIKSTEPKEPEAEVQDEESGEEEEEEVEEYSGEETGEEEEVEEYSGEETGEEDEEDSSGEQDLSDNDLERGSEMDTRENSEEEKFDSGEEVDSGEDEDSGEEVDSGEDDDSGEDEEDEVITMASTIYHHHDEL